MDQTGPAKKGRTRRKKGRKEERGGQSKVMDDSKTW